MRIADILQKYALLLQNIDEKCEEILEETPEIPCKNRCFECCKQLFPVSFIEAYYISEGFKKLPRRTRRDLQNNAEKINEKIKKHNPWHFEKYHTDKKTALQTHLEFAKFLNNLNIDCPALAVKGGQGACLVYNFRNHDCRAMGFSVDFKEKAIIGCSKFDKLKYLIPRLMDYYYLYPEKMSLDRECIGAAVSDFFTPNIIYYTTMCSPLMKDYAKTDWFKFFENKGIPKKEDSNQDEYFAVIDI